MDELEELQIQWDKVKNGYKTMTTDEIAALREKILLCFDSEEMRNYLRDHFDELGSSKLIEIIVGAQKPLEYKASLMTELAERFPHPFEELDDCYDFEVFAQQYQKAFTDMKINPDEQVIYLLRCYDCDDECDSMPFFTFESARNYIKDYVRKWKSSDDEEDPDYLWFKIEKWVGKDSPIEKSVYTLSTTGEIWDYLDKSKNEGFLCNTFGIGNALGLNLPVPFSAGDVVKIDCRPFVPYAQYGVILSIGDNMDCCCVQWLHLEEDGTVDFHALKHASEFKGISSYISVLYSIERYQGELPQEETFMSELSSEIARWYQRDPDKYEKEWFDKLHALTEHRDCTPDKLMDGIRSINRSCVAAE